jgi:hypothetical protein
MKNLIKEILDLYATYPVKLNKEKTINPNLNIKFIRKEIQDENEKTLFNLIAEVYYDGDFIMFDGDNTDLRMSNINFDIGKKEKVSKNEKNDNR